MARDEPTIPGSVATFPPDSCSRNSSPFWRAQSPEIYRSSCMPGLVALGTSSCFVYPSKFLRDMNPIIFRAPLAAPKSKASLPLRLNIENDLTSITSSLFDLGYCDTSLPSKATFLITQDRILHLDPCPDRSIRK